LGTLWRLSAPHYKPRVRLAAHAVRGARVRVRVEVRVRVRVRVRGVA
jgi:hypothetical protein